jgi:hypothetical protein
VQVCWQNKPLLVNLPANLEIIFVLFSGEKKRQALCNKKCVSLWDAGKTSADHLLGPESIVIEA